MIETGIEIIDARQDEYKLLKSKIEGMRDRGLSYQAIADLFNIWQVSTRTGEGKWHPKTIRELADSGR